MNLARPIATGLMVIAAAFGLSWYSIQAQKNAAAAQPRATQTVDTGKAIALADIKQHADEKSCWTTINGGVYDLTEWVGKHPGGREAILSICGKDGSAPFNAQHGGAALQQQILKGYQIGVLAK